MLYDEPTAGLDPVNAFAIGHLILQLKAKGVTQVVVTHDLDLAFRVADHLVMIQRGCMVFTGSPLNWPASRTPKSEDSWIRHPCRPKTGTHSRAVSRNDGRPAMRSVR